MDAQSFFKLPFGACRSCGTPRAHQILRFRDLVGSGVSVAEALDQLNIGTLCCMNLFESPDFFPLMGPGRLQIQYQQALKDRYEKLQELQALLQNFKGFTLADLDNPDLVQLNQLGLWLSRTLGDSSGVISDQEVILWGGSTSESLVARLEKFMEEPSLPQALIEKLDQLKAILEQQGLSLEDLEPLEAKFVRRNLARLQKRYQLELTDDLAQDFSQALEVVGNERLLWSRPALPQKLFGELERLQLDRLDLTDPEEIQYQLEVIQSNFDQIRQRYREISALVQNLVPGQKFENLIDRIERIPQGQLSQEFLEKADQFLELVGVLEFPGEKSFALADLRRLYELRADLINDSSASLAQVAENLGNTFRQGSHDLGDLINSPQTALIYPPPSGVRQVQRRLKLFTIGMDPVARSQGKTSIAQARSQLKLVPV